MSTQTIFVKAGATNQTSDLSLVQNAGATSPGNAITGLAYNTPGFTTQYYRNGATGALTSFSLATQTVTGSYSSGGFVEVSPTNVPGQYRFDIPNAAIPINPGDRSYITFNGAASQAIHTLCLIGSAAVNVESFGGTAGTFASGIPSVNTTQISGVSLASGSGAIVGLGIVDKGTAQSASSTTLVLRSAAAFADNELNGATILISGGTGVGQRRIITTYAAGSKTATVDTWTTTPGGTITYEIYGTAPASSSGAIAANVTQWNGTNVATPATAGIPEVNVKRINNVATASVTTVNANQGTTQPVNFTGTGASALAKSDMVDIAGAAVSTTAAQIGVNTVNIGGTTQTGRDIGASVLLSNGTGAGQISLTSGLVRLSAAGVADILTTALAESYAADGAAGTLSQILFGIQAFLQERAVSGTTLTVKKLDGTTTAMTFTLNDATAPTSLTRSS